MILMTMKNNKSQKLKQADGSESPRTSALRAMGVHATNVIDIMQSRDGETPIYMPPQESLTPIAEENELESSGSMKYAIPAITIDVRMICALCAPISWFENARSAKQTYYWFGLNLSMFF